MQEFRGLLLNRSDHLRMRMTSRDNRDPGVEVEEMISIDIFDDRAFSALHHKGIAARVRGGEDSAISLDDRFCLRSGPSSDQIRHLYIDSNLLPHSNPTFSGSARNDVESAPQP